MNKMKTAANEEAENSAPTVLERSQHPISRRDIDPDALKVLYRLYRNGFKAYLVGGAVRDLLLGKKPKDFDVVTDAHPGQVKKLFSNCFLIGRRFRLAHIRFRGGNIIEVATFRKEPEEDAEVESDPNNTFGTPREDAFRRDLTINALFYDISNFSIIDYVGGLKDMEDRRACIIGDPDVRYREDPVRIWRVIRHAARIDFSIEHHSSDEIKKNRDLLATASGARLFEELNKDLSSGYLYPVLGLLRQYEILPLLLGDAGRLLQEDTEPVKGILDLLRIVDMQAGSRHGLSNEIVLSLLFWPWAQRIIRDETSEIGDIFAVLHERLQASGMTVTVPKSLKMNITQILAIVDRMFTAMDTGRMRWSLKKRSRYNDASLVFHLLHKGELSDARDPFGDVFQEKYPSSGTTAGRRRRYPRRRRRKAKPAPETTT